MILPGTTALLEPAAIRCWAATSAAALRARRADLDALNVFPVADSDTGTNLYLTLAEAAAAVDRVPVAGSADDLARAFGRGALVGARGNSGVIVGQYLGALVRVLLPSPTHLVPGPTVAGGVLRISVPALAAALEAAAAAAYQAVARPVEGTVLTIGRAVGEHAAAAAGRSRRPPEDVGSTIRPVDDTVVTVLDEAIAVGYEALLRTTSQLPALRAAGVLDAGAWGLLLVLDALAHCLGSTVALERSAAGVTLRGAVPPEAATCLSDEAPDQAAAPTAVATGGDRPGERAVDREAGAGTGGGEFEVMYLVAAPVAPDGDRPDRAPAPRDLSGPLRSGLSAVGDSAAVMGGDGLWQVHVHTDRPLDALDVASGVHGVVSQVRVRHLASQAGVHGHHRPPLGLVAVTAAPGLVADLARAGAVVVLVPSGGSVGRELRRAVEDTGAVRVLLLAAAPLDDRPEREGLEVVDGLSEPQVVTGAATLASLDHTAPAGDLLSDVVRAVGAVRTVTVPPPAPDDVGGWGHGELVMRAADRLLASGGTLVTAVTGAASGAAVLDALRARVADGAEGAELVVLAGGAPGPDVVLGVE